MKQKSYLTELKEKIALEAVKANALQIMISWNFGENPVHDRIHHQAADHAHAR
jgi:hypothetical protein